ncbi:hypothetical protein EJB05_34438, partial [Eragrostis curvula]
MALTGGCSSMDEEVAARLRHYLSEAELAAMEEGKMKKLLEILHRQQEEARRRRENPNAMRAAREAMLRRVEDMIEQSKEFIPQRLEAEKRILDFDPKQGGEYYSRLPYVVDIITFDHDEECK